MPHFLYCFIRFLLFFFLKLDFCGIYSHFLKLCHAFYAYFLENHCFYVAQNKIFSYMPQNTGKSPCPGRFATLFLLILWLNLRKSHICHIICSKAPRNRIFATSLMTMPQNYITYKPLKYIYLIPLQINTHIYYKIAISSLQKYVYLVICNYNL